MTIGENKRRMVLQKYNGRCGYCGRELFLGDPEKTDRGGLSHAGKEQYNLQFCIDHINPLSNGGKNHIDNLMPACRWCNSSKGKKSLEQFRYRTAWMTEADIVFSAYQIKWLEQHGFIMPEYEKDFVFYFEMI